MSETEKKIVITRLKALREIYKIYTYASLEKRTEIENEIMNMYNTEKAE